MQYSVHTFNIILCNNHIKNAALYKCPILTTPFCANVTRMSRDTSSSVGPLQASFNLSFCINYAPHISQVGHFKNLIKQVKMLSRLLKEHQVKQNERKELQGKYM